MIKQKKIVIEDVNSFFSNFLESSKAGMEFFKKEQDIMIQTITIDNELLINKDEQLFKLLSFTFMILHQLIKRVISSNNSPHDQKMAGQDDAEKKRIIFIIKITTNLDNNLKLFLNSIKRVLLIRTIELRLVIIEGEKILAGLEEEGQKVEGMNTSFIYKYTDLAHFMTPFQYEEQAKYLMNGCLLLCNKQSLNIEIL